MRRGLVAVAIGALLLAGARHAAAQAARLPRPPAPIELPRLPAPAPPAEPASVKVTPYGIVYFNGFHNSEAMNNEDVPLWAIGGPGDTSATARQSRFGFRVSVPPALGAKISSVVEADFFGGFPTIGIGENFGQVRLRLANARLDWAQDLAGRRPGLDGVRARQPDVARLRRHPAVRGRGQPVGAHPPGPAGAALRLPAHPGRGPGTPERRLQLHVPRPAQLGGALAAALFSRPHSARLEDLHGQRQGGSHRRLGTLRPVSGDAHRRDNRRTSTPRREPSTSTFRSVGT